MSFDGTAEAEWIMSPATGIGALYGGRVWEGGVPVGYVLPKVNGRIAPYLTVHFGTPVPIAGTQTVAGGVRSADYLMGVSVHVHASTLDDLKAGTRAVLRRMVGMEPSGTGNAGEITPSGGRTFDSEDNSGESTRYMRMIYFLVPVGFNDDDENGDDWLIISGGAP